MKREDINHALETCSKLYPNGKLYRNKYKVIESYVNNLTGFQTSVVQIETISNMTSTNTKTRLYLRVDKEGDGKAYVNLTQRPNAFRQGVIKDFRERIIRLL